ncbi:RING-H2 finger protein ATL47 [Morus notabilis]|uniref:RING-type E3 ubiquitin transferase n=2 Tax=Morus notabilis TaxID=981085 RepID=W9SX80_9ROSA|nr:RING-H2 finger protein ATL47 [Morus notabilis]
MVNNRVMTVAGQVMVMAIILSIIFLFVGIGLLIFVHVCIVGRAFRRGFGNVSVAMERGSNGSDITGSTSMSKDDLEKLPCFDYMTKDTATSPVDCAVCLESFQVGEKCRLLPICKHSFHAECVDAWLLQAPFCPMCRTSADSSKGSGDPDASLEMIGESQTAERSGHLRK